MDISFDFLSLLRFRQRPFDVAFVPSKVFSDLDAFRYSFPNLKKYLRQFKIKVSKAFVTVSGEYDYENNLILISIYDKYSELEDVPWLKFKFELVQTIMHELVHWSQYSMRYNEPIFHDGYYSHPDEIQAYSHDCMLESQYPELVNFPTKDMVFENLELSDKVKYLKWTNRWMYKYNNHNKEFS